MAQNMNTGNSIQPLHNVAALATLVKRMEGRTVGAPGLAAFHGPPGFGKSYACAYAAASLGCIHISVQSLWTKKTLLTVLLRELSIVPHKTMAEMFMQINEALITAGRTLLIDEADYAIDRGMIEIIRDMQDGSDVPIILVGMEQMPQKLRKWELVDSRVYAYLGAEPTDIDDARLLAKVYANGLQLDDALLARVVAETKGSARRITNNFGYIREQARLEGITEMTLKAWGNRPFHNSEAPKPRGGLT